MQTQAHVDVTLTCTTVFLSSAHLKKIIIFFNQTLKKTLFFAALDWTRTKTHVSEQRDKAEGQTFEGLEKGNVPRKLKRVINKQGCVENEACVIQWNKSFRLAQMMCFHHSNC